MSETNDTTREFINVEKILKTKAPSLYKKMPRFLVRYFTKVLHQDEVNSDLQKISDLVGVPKFHKHLAINNIEIDYHGKENVPSDGRFIFVSNHPFGGPDGIMIVSAVGKMFPKTKLMVNDLLMYLPDIEDVFIPINRFGRNKHEYVDTLEKSMNSDYQIIIFPAGLVSRKIKGKIVDLEWKKSFVSYAKRYQRDIIPVFISGQNSNFFYNLANWRKRLGIKVNIEQLYLVDELYKHKNESVSMYFGKPIKYTDLSKDKTDAEWAQEIKQIVYSLKTDK
ncbi:MAG: 1-acyl-sn-glycerol-3-phosphate acyltransferase [Bacteroidales bacterium]|nr:1-acyl-sn-glycerol-3-phosphate acyltransferase [Bacteroidales bacterium]